MELGESQVHSTGLSVGGQVLTFSSQYGSHGGNSTFQPHCDPLTREGAGKGKAPAKFESFQATLLMVWLGVPVSLCHCPLGS